ncbi:WD40 repeat domain-containing protein [Nostoc sp. FACHB-152]|uniref:WD40 repeat domain-containing protein n=1 Tax=unclassified Nostoc TaxID=2593658 RepID=UPI00168489A2|nr:MULTISPECIES: WD40 repeat domain-containing protein [unclassified Nostoc]MBD2452007.1 WD40 repeat domain-containing protein [Nostoc sp. FACHB-152]MBD2472995.1 WD40 repeat domain-containing protein [Nostoc sp. FACHB-145]
MSANHHRPRKYDAVLGNQAETPVDGVVLGGLEGVKSHLKSTVFKAQASALNEAVKYGDVGLDLVFNATKSSEWQLQNAAEKLLIQKRTDPKFQQKLLDFNPWLFVDCVLTVEGHLDKVNSVAISPDNLTLASGSNDKTVKIWSLLTGEIQRTLTGHTSKVNAVVFSPDGRLVSCSGDNTIKFWDWQRGKLVNSLEEVHSKSVDAIAISPDGKIIISTSWHIKVADLLNGKEISTLEGNGYISSLAISPDSKIFVNDCYDTIKVREFSKGNFLDWWKLKITTPRLLKGHSGKVNTLAISTDGKTLVSGGEDKTIKVWNLQTGELKRTFLGHTGKVNAVAISADSQIIASASNDKTVKIWDLNKGCLLRTLEGHTKVVRTVAISPDGQTIVSGSWDKTIKVWKANFSN